MPIPSQPTTNISLGPTLAPTNRSISNEFGEAQPSHALSQFYRGGSFVANHPINNGVPTSGSIAMSQFNGSSIVLRYIISSSIQNLNLFSYASSPSRVGTTKSQGYQNDGKYTAGQPGFGIEFVINPGVVVGSATRTQSAFVTGVDSPTTGWHPDIKIVVKNQGYIVGAGGTGGEGGGFTQAPPTRQPTTAYYNGYAGLSGGNAIIAQRPIVVQNQGTVGGGGGGGGGDGAYYESVPDPKFPYVIAIAGSGGGGGAGQTIGAGGAGGLGGPSYSQGIPGNPATYPSTLTQGGRSGNDTTIAGMGAPLGGGPTAQPGQAGAPSVYQPSPGVAQGGAGAAPGFYARGNANITWQENGTRLGQVSPTV